MQHSEHFNLTGSKRCPCSTGRNLGKAVLNSSTLPDAGRSQTPRCLTDISLPGPHRLEGARRALARRVPDLDAAVLAATRQQVAGLAPTGRGHCAAVPHQLGRLRHAGHQRCIRAAGPRERQRLRHKCRAGLQRAQPALLQAPLHGCPLRRRRSKLGAAKHSYSSSCLQNCAGLQQRKRAGPVLLEAPLHCHGLPRRKSVAINNLSQPQ